jgi:hypothetical protein
MSTLRQLELQGKILLAATQPATVESSNYSILLQQQVELELH